MPSGYWTKERCALEAKKYKSRTELQQSSSSAYSIAHRNGWLEEITTHMPQRQMPGGYWTKERCAAEATKYKTRIAFEKGASGAYAAARRKGWLKEITAHLPERHMPIRKWTYEALEEEAAHYSSRYEFQRKNSGAYQQAIKHGVLEDICRHMTEGRAPNRYWTKERCAAEAKKYDSRSEFRESSGSAAVVAGSNGWLDEICSHMERKIQQSGHWTKENIIKEAAKYNSRTEFFVFSQSAYATAQKRGWLDAVCEQFGETLGGFDPTKPGRLYYVRVDTDTGPLYKIGITNTSVKVRFFGPDLKRITPLKYWQFQNGVEAKRLESLILTHCKDHRYTGDPILFSGNTELFTHDIFGIDTDLTVDQS